VADVSYNDAFEEDRDRVDDEMSGEVVIMAKEGSGTITIREGDPVSGYVNGDMVVTRNQVSVSGGSESVTPTTKTFKKVTFNVGANVDNNAGPGTISIAFNYGFDN